MLIFLLVDPSVLAEPRRFISQARMESELAHNGHLFAAAASPLGWLHLLGGGDLLGPLALVLGVVGLFAWSVRDLRALPNPPAPFVRNDGNEGEDDGDEGKRSSPPFPPIAVNMSLRGRLWDRRRLAGQRATGRRDAGGPSSTRSSVLSPQSSWSPESCRRLPLAVWTLGYLLLLLVWVADRQPRYALPVLPGLALYAAAATAWLSRRLPASRLTLAFLLIAAAVPLGVRLGSYEQAQARRLDNPSIAARIAAGRWLAGQASSETPVLYDAYAYLPPGFTDTQETFGLTRAQIDAFRPQIILTDAEIRDRFRDPPQAGAYRGGVAAYQATAATYAALDAGALPCYPLLRDFGSVRIYGRLSGGC